MMDLFLSLESLSASVTTLHPLKIAHIAYVFPHPRKHIMIVRLTSSTGGLTSWPIQFWASSQFNYSG